MLNPQIPLSIQPVKIQSPLEAMTRVLTVQQALDQRRMRQMDIEEARRKAAAEDALNEAYRVALNPDGTVNRDAVTKGLAGSGQGHLIPDVLKSLTASEQATATLAKTRGEVDAQHREAVEGMAFGVAQSGYTPSGFLTGVASLERRGILTHDDAVRYVAPIFKFIGNEAGLRNYVKGIADQVVAGSPKYSKLAQDAAGAQRKTALFPSQEAKAEADVTTARATARQRQIAEWSARLAPITDSESYAEEWAMMPREVRGSFPTPKQWNAKRSPDVIRRAAMTSAEQVNADLRARSVAVSEQREQREHEAGTGGTSQAQQAAAERFRFNARVALRKRIEDAKLSDEPMTDEEIAEAKQDIEDSYARQLQQAVAERRPTATRGPGDIELPAEPTATPEGARANNPVPAPPRAKNAAVKAPAGGQRFTDPAMRQKAREALASRGYDSSDAAIDVFLSKPQNRALLGFK